MNEALTQKEKGLAQLPAEVISVQSQVLYGSVGNSIAVPVLTSKGINTLGIPTFLLSNTPDYPSCYGGEIQDEWFKGFFKGINDRGLDASPRAVITGYLGSVSKATDVCEWFYNVRKFAKGTLIVTDPVLGDDDTGFYVDPALVNIYRERLAPMATGLTPNRFELASLTGRRIVNENDAITAARMLLIGYTKWVVVTSAMQCSSTRVLKILCVTESSVDVVEHELFSIAPKGTGDFFTAELTSHLLKGLKLQEAVKTASINTGKAITASVHDGSGVLHPI